MTLYELREKHERLAKLDGGKPGGRPAYQTFGSDTHQYQLNPCLTEDVLQNFEQAFSINLPPDYRNFLKEIGNGGSGPAYGLLQLSEWNLELFIDDDDFLSTAFPHEQAWNIPQNYDEDDPNVYETEDFLKWEEEYYSNAHITGSMRISHYGCAIYYLLVVTGKNAGEVWVDDRANFQGIFPAISKLGGNRLRFIDWYDEWLTESLSAYE